TKDGWSVRIPTKKTCPAVSLGSLQKWKRERGKLHEDFGINAAHGKGRMAEMEEHGHRRLRRFGDRRGQPLPVRAPVMERKDRAGSTRRKGYRSDPFRQCLRACGKKGIYQKDRLKDPQPLCDPPK